MSSDQAEGQKGCVCCGLCFLVWFLVIYFFGCPDSICGYVPNATPDAWDGEAQATLCANYTDQLTSHTSIKTNS